MKEPQIRLYNSTPGDQENLINWTTANAFQNGIQPEMYGYPATRVLVADPMDGEEPWLMAPVHPVYIVDSLAPNPNATPAQVGLALRKIMEVAKWEGQNAGHGEIFFCASEPRIAQFAVRHERFRPASRLFRMNLRGF